MKFEPKATWLLVLLLIPAYVLFARNPESSMFFPRCPLLTATGILCPGCGSQRALHHLAHARLGEAWRFNPLVVLFTPLFLAYLVHLIRPLPGLRRLVGLSWFAYAVLIVTVLFWIARNLPIAAFDGLRPG